MLERQRLIAIAGLLVLVAGCGGGSGSTGLQTTVGHVTLTIANDTTTATSEAVASAAGPSPTSGPTPAVGRSLRVDAGFSGLAHRLQVFEGASYTAELHDCDGTDDTQCTLVAKTAGTAFGAPTPLSVGGVPVCLLIDYASDLTGTLDLATGALSEEARVAIRIYADGDIAQPCPACVPADRDPQLGETGVCAGGRDHGQPCTVDALADPSFFEFRGTSHSCQPFGDPIGQFTTAATATTGHFALATSADSPNCRAAGWQDQKCLCDVCDDADATPCRSNADCPSHAGAASVCGATNRGTPTRQNACDDRVCTPDGVGLGVCENGPIDSHCALQPFRACLDVADCPIAGDSCTPSPRSCLLDRIDLTGTPDAPQDGVAHPTLVGGFCLGMFGSAAANTAGGFPGPVSYVWPARLVVEQ